jgi:hypothetical protein
VGDVEEEPPTPQPKLKIVFVPCSSPSEANVIVTVKGQRYQKKLVYRSYDYSPFVNNGPKLVEAFRYEYTKLDGKAKPQPKEPSNETEVNQRRIYRQ